MDALARHRRRFCSWWCRAFSAVCAWFWHDAQLGIFHAIVGQLFFVLICAIALFTSRFWQNLQTGRAGSPLPDVGAHGAARPTETSLRTLVLLTTILIFCQLIIAARPCDNSTPVWPFPISRSPTEKSGRTPAPVAVAKLQRTSHERDRGKSDHGFSDYFADDASPRRAGDFHFDRDLRRGRRVGGLAKMILWRNSRCSGWR